MKNPIYSFAFIFQIPLIFLGCGRESESHPFIQVGATDSYLAHPDLSPEWVKTFARVMGWLSNHCTVTHIGSALGVTAGHCVNALKNLETNQTCEGVSVRWISDDMFKLGPSIPCRKILALQQNGDLDFAILEFETPALNKIEIARSPRLDHPIKILSFPHGDLTYSMGCQSWQDQANLNLVKHDCDTQSGSSGAALLIDNKIAALHRGSRDGVNVALSVEYINQSLGDLNLSKNQRSND